MQNGKKIEYPNWLTVQNWHTQSSVHSLKKAHTQFLYIWANGMYARVSLKLWQTHFDCEARVRLLASALTQNICVVF